MTIVCSVYNRDSRATYTLLPRLFFHNSLSHQHPTAESLTLQILILEAFKRRILLVRAYPQNPVPWHNVWPRPPGQWGARSPQRPKLLSNNRFIQWLWYQSTSETLYTTICAGSYYNKNWSRCQGHRITTLNLFGKLSPTDLVAGRHMKFQLRRPPKSLSSLPSYPLFHFVASYLAQILLILWKVIWSLFFSWIGPYSLVYYREAQRCWGFQFRDLNIPLKRADKWK